MPSSIIIGSGGSGSGGGSGSNASVGVNGAVAPTSSTEIGFINGSGNEVGVSATNPLPVTGTVTETNASIGATGAPAPTSATEIGIIDNSGNLRGVSSSFPLRIDPTGTTIQPVSGTITANQGTSPWVVSLTSTTVTGVVEVSPTTAANTKTNPFFTEISDGTNTVTTNSTATSGKFGLDTNILSILGTAPTTAGFLDIKGADGNVFVRQATAANLNATVVGNKTNNNAAPDGSNVGALTTVANAAAPTLTEGDLALLSSALNGHLRVGTKTNNNAAPAANAQVGSLGAIANAVAPTWTEGNQVLQSVDLNGSLRVMSGNIPETTAAWTSATAGNTALTQTILGYSAVVVTLNQGTTITGGVVTFEVSDTTAGTNWYPILVTNAGVSSGTLASTFTLVASTNSQFMIPVAGWAAFRVRLSTVISGTATVNVGIQAANFPVSQNTLNVVSGSIINARGNTAVAALADNQASTTFFASSTNVNDPLSVGDWAYGGAFSGAADAARQGWSKRRTSTVFKTIQATASGNTAVWTPGSGNKFRILKVMVQVTDNASLAAGAVLTISFQDATTAMPIAFDIFVPTTAVTTTAGAAFTQELDLGDFGILSAAANNVFNVNLSAALATGNARIIAMGVEE